MYICIILKVELKTSPLDLNKCISYIAFKVRHVWWEQPFRLTHLYTWNFIEQIAKFEAKWKFH